MVTALFPSPYRGDLSSTRLILLVMVQDMYGFRPLIGVTFPQLKDVVSDKERNGFRPLIGVTFPQPNKDESSLFSFILFPSPYRGDLSSTG